MSFDNMFFFFKFVFLKNFQLVCFPFWLVQLDHSLPRAKLDKEVNQEYKVAFTRPECPLKTLPAKNVIIHL